MTSTEDIRDISWANGGTVRGLVPASLKVDMKRHISWVWFVLVVFSLACDDSVPPEYEVPDGVTIASIDLTVMPERPTLSAIP